MGYTRHSLNEFARAHYQSRTPNAPDAQGLGDEGFSREELEILFAADLMMATRYATWMDADGKSRTGRGTR